MTRRLKGSARRGVAKTGAERVPGPKGVHAGRWTALAAAPRAIVDAEGSRHDSDPP